MTEAGTAPPNDVLAAIYTLAACDHFDVSRRIAPALPANLALVDLLRAADGATRLARDLDVARRINR